MSPRAVCRIPGCSGAHTNGRHDFRPRLLEISRELEAIDHRRAVLERERRLLEMLAATSRGPALATPAPELPILLSKEQVGEILGIKAHAVWEEYNRGRLKGTKIARKLRFNLEEVLRYIQGR
jgi:hypothetical protein